MPRCNRHFHFPCAIKSNCVFYVDNTISCLDHVPANSPESDIVRMFDMYLCCYIKRDITRQIGSTISNGELVNDDPATGQSNSYILKFGSYLLSQIGLINHQSNPHNSQVIFPIGYESMVIISVNCPMTDPNACKKPEYNKQKQYPYFSSNRIINNQIINGHHEEIPVINIPKPKFVAETSKERKFVKFSVTEETLPDTSSSIATSETTHHNLKQIIFTFNYKRFTSIDAVY